MAAAEAVPPPTVALSDRSRMAVEDVARTQQRFDEFELDVSRASSAGDNYLGVIYRVTVRGTRKRDNGEEEPERSSCRLIVKAAPLGEIVRQELHIDRIFAREQLVYSQLLPKLAEYQAALPDEDRLRFARMYAGRCDANEELLVMEDLAEEGFVMYDRLRALDLDHLTMCIKNMARLHAAAFALKVRDPARYAELASNSATMADFGYSPEKYFDMLKPGALEAAAGEPYEENVRQLFADPVATYNALFDAKPAEPYDVLCHGDCWSNNFLFRYENGKLSEMIFLDWQMMRCSSPCFDIGYFLFSATDQETRRSHYRDLLDLYYETLSSNLSKLGLDPAALYPEPIYRQHLKFYQRHCLLVATMLLPMTQVDREEAKELQDFMDDAFKAVEFSKACVRRLKGLYEDALEWGMF